MGRRQISARAEHPRPQNRSLLHLSWEHQRQSYKTIKTATSNPSRSEAFFVAKVELQRESRAFLPPSANFVGRRSDHCSWHISPLLSTRWEERKQEGNLRDYYPAVVGHARQLPTVQWRPLHVIYSLPSRASQDGTEPKTLQVQNINVHKKRCLV